MHLRPANVEELSASLRCAYEKREKVAAIDLRAFDQLIEHKAEDMTATVASGMQLRDFQSLLKRAGQWLPIDPPNAEHLTISDLLSHNASGPRRFGYGTVRDYLIGLKVVLADGRIIESGGKVVKNVAGYDLARLFIGAEGSLGVIAEATFKLRPLPEVESFLQRHCQSFEDAEQVISGVLDSSLSPVILDLHNVHSGSTGAAVVIGCDGVAEAVEWQTAKGMEMGFAKIAALDYEKLLWQSGSVEKVSLKPSRLVETLQSLRPETFVARAGNGILYHRGARIISRDSSPSALMWRLKNEFDPHGILPTPSFMKQEDKE